MQLKTIKRLKAIKTLRRDNKNLKKMEIPNIQPKRRRTFWKTCAIWQGRHFNFFLGGPKFFLFFNATGLLKNWKKQHFICSNLTLFIVPFFLFFSFFSFLSFFSFFLSFFLFFFFLGGGGGATPPQPPLNDASAIWGDYT